MPHNKMTCAPRWMCCTPREHHLHLLRIFAHLDRLLDADAQDWVDHDGRFVWVAGEATIMFASHKGRSQLTLASEESGDLACMLDTDFAPDVKKIIRAALRGELPRERNAHHDFIVTQRLRVRRIRRARRDLPKAFVTHFAPVPQHAPRPRATPDNDAWHFISLFRRAR